jgi:hypothetical protein
MIKFGVALLQRAKVVEHNLKARNVRTQSVKS